MKTLYTSLITKGRIDISKSNHLVEDLETLSDSFYAELCEKGEAIKSALRFADNEDYLAYNPSTSNFAYSIYALDDTGLGEQFHFSNIFHMFLKIRLQSFFANQNTRKTLC